MIRYFDPLYPLVWLGLLVAAAVAAVILKKRLSRRLRIAVVLLAPIVVVALTWLYLAPPVEAIGKPGIVKLDSRGQLIVENGHSSGVGWLNEAGNYQVSLNDGRFFILHLPKGYKSDKSLSWLVLLHGSDETEPLNFAFRYTKMNELADHYGFIVVYPVAQAQYALWAEPHYDWNSRLGLLSQFNPHFADDAAFVENIHKWVLRHTSADPERFSLGGFSGGALLASRIAQSGRLPINWLFSCGGTMLEGQQDQHLQGKGPKNIFLQLNTEDKKILPLDTAGVVVKGESYGLVTNMLGFWNLANSRPSLQERFWLDEAILEGGTEQQAIAVAQPGDWRCTTHDMKMPGDAEKKIVIYHVRGQHAWHGSPQGGDPDQNIAPNMNVPLSDFIAVRVMNSVASDK